MAQYIDKDALVAGIEKIIPSEPYPRTSETLYGAEKYGKREMCFKILDLIDTLEVKEIDSKLTLEDISILRQTMFDYNRQVRNEMSIPNDEEYCKEVLKRFKAQKGE